MPPMSWAEASMTAPDSFFQLSKQAFGPFVGTEDGVFGPFVGTEDGVFSPFVGSDDGVKVGSWSITGAFDGSFVIVVSDGALVGGKSVIGQSSASKGVHVELSASITKIAVQLSLRPTELERPKFP